MNTLRVLIVAALLILAPPVAADDIHPGRRAVESGQEMAERIQAIMKASGFAPLRHADWMIGGDQAGDYLLSSVPYTTLYGSPGREAFRIVSPRRGLEAGLIVKRQDTSGSTDTVLPYLYLTALEAMPERQVFIIIDGQGWRDGGLDWLRKAVAQRRYGTAADKDVRIMTLAQFQAWAKAL